MIGTKLNYVISALLILAVSFTGATGYLSARLDLNRFLPHKYGAYATLLLVALHLVFNFKKLARFLFGRRPGKKK